MSPSCAIAKHKPPGGFPPGRLTTIARFFCRWGPAPRGEAGSPRPGFLRTLPQNGREAGEGNRMVFPQSIINAIKKAFFYNSKRATIWLKFSFSSAESSGTKKQGLSDRALLSKRENQKSQKHLQKRRVVL